MNYFLSQQYNGKDIIITQNKIILMLNGIPNEKQLTMDIDEIRKQISLIGVKKPYNSENYNLYYYKPLEDAAIPYINYIYYYLFFINLKIPTLNEMLDTYIKFHCYTRPDGMLEIKREFGNIGFAFTKEQLHGRIFRAYNSFHREIELFFQLKNYEGINIEYSFAKDLKGIDFTVTYNNKIYYLATFVDSHRSSYWKKIKDNERHSELNERLINISAIINPKEENYNCRYLNGVYLYNPVFVANMYVDMVKKNS